ncbi:hypothetical protein COV56_03585 [Candidatus Kuenenbacteria bacterium CG11_big_fil_rev_8_21_14_0_20_37_9]|nr:MAG: hypothetical protein COV56_03585 [Candidatus Kuenenbacteria bacterium CG11_big_fil_rev_8_21_14_0_20_37_9]
MKSAKYNKKTTDPLGEFHDVVDENDKVVGIAPRIKFLKNKNLIRRSCHIWLRNSEGKFWFQQRSKGKDLQPLHWSCSAAGFASVNARSKKKILENAKRELKEELGITADIELAKIYLHRSQIVGGIMVYLYIGEHNGPFKIDHKEVSDIKAFDYHEVWELYKSEKIKLTTPTIDELKFFLKI